MPVDVEVAVDVEVDVEVVVDVEPAAPPPPPGGGLSPELQDTTRSAQTAVSVTPRPSAPTRANDGTLCMGGRMAQLALK